MLKRGNFELIYFGWVGCLGVWYRTFWYRVWQNYCVKDNFITKSTVEKRACASSC